MSQHWNQRRHATACDHRLATDAMASTASAALSATLADACDSIAASNRIQPEETARWAMPGVNLSHMRSAIATAAADFARSDGKDSKSTSRASSSRRQLRMLSERSSGRRSRGARPSIVMTVPLRSSVCSSGRLDMQAKVAGR